VRFDGPNNLEQSRKHSLPNRRLGCALLLCDAHRQAEGNTISSAAVARWLSSDWKLP